MQIVIELIQRPKINVSVTPKISVCILPHANIFFKITGTFSWTHLKQFI